jgi:hypothetical protein
MAEAGIEAGGKKAITVADDQRGPAVNLFADSSAQAKRYIADEKGDGFSCPKSSRQKTRWSRILRLFISPMNPARLCSTFGNQPASLFRCYPDRERSGLALRYVCVGRRQAMRGREDRGSFGG